MVNTWCGIGIGLSWLPFTGGAARASLATSHGIESPDGFRSDTSSVEAPVRETRIMRCAPSPMTAERY